MGARIHYEDDLFFLHSMLKTLDSGLRLSIDPEYFRDKVLEDLFFIEGLLMRVFAALKDNTMLLRRATYLRSLRRTVVACIELVSRMIDGDLGQGIVTDAYHEKLHSVVLNHEQIVREIDGILDSSGPEERTNDIVSSEEYSYLLASGEADDAGAEE